MYYRGKMTVFEKHPIQTKLITILYFGAKTTTTIRTSVMYVNQYLIIIQKKSWNNNYRATTQF